MHYSCDLDVVKTSFSVHTLPKLYFDISKEIVSIWQNPDMFENLQADLKDSEIKRNFIIEDNKLICNTVSKDIDRSVHMLYKLADNITIDSGSNQESANIIFVLVSPESDGPIHLRRLSRLSRTMTDKAFSDRLDLLQDKDSLRSLFMYPDLEEKAA